MVDLEDMMRLTVKDYMKQAIHVRAAAATLSPRRLLPLSAARTTPWSRE
jgi:hypothetical protein